MTQPLYSIGTWDTDEQAFTPQIGVPAFNLTRKQLVESMRMLQQCGYPCHRIKQGDEYYSDCYVLIERTDGKPETEILEGWKR